jgi:SNF2 family DNA or RNA helicase
LATGLLPVPLSTTGVDEGENFAEALNAIKFTAEDNQRLSATEANKDMMELLSGAIGDGENDDVKEGDDEVEGFATGIRLMPHQVRGTQWMKGREAGRKNGGILADVS